MNLAVRFQGKDIEKDGGWGWYFFISLGGDPQERMDSPEIFPTREAAIINMRQAVKASCDALEGEFGSYEYFDLKENTIVKWDETNE